MILRLIKSVFVAVLSFGRPLTSQSLEYILNNETRLATIMFIIC